MGHITDKIYNLYERRAVQEEPRQYLGCSIIGKECDRYLWLAFRWAYRELYEGRVLKLFNTGKRHETRIFAEMRGAGIKVSDRQKTVSAASGHILGHIDGRADGILTEVKTHGDWQFKEVAKKGVKQAQPVYFAQIQTYLILLGDLVATYLGINKNTDHLYEEEIRLDTVAGRHYLTRGETIVHKIVPPDRLDKSAKDVQPCKWCSMHKLCWEGAEANKNCRTCLYSSPHFDKSTWYCAMHMREISFEEQKVGCEKFKLIEALRQ